MVSPKNFGIPNMDLQNIYWEFRSLGHSDLDQRFSKDADFS